MAIKKRSQQQRSQQQRSQRRPRLGWLLMALMLLLGAQAQSAPLGGPDSDHSTPKSEGGAARASEVQGIDPELQRALLQKLAEAENHLENAVAELGDSGRELDPARELLTAVRAGLSNDSRPEAGAVMDEQIAKALETAQGRLEELRARAETSPNADVLLAQLHERQQQLDLMKTRLAFSASLPGDGAFTDETVAQMVWDARRVLDRAAARAAKLPNAQELLLQIEDARRKLDASAAGYGAQSASGG